VDLANQVFEPPASRGSAIQSTFAVLQPVRGQKSIRRDQRSFGLIGELLGELLGTVTKLLRTQQELVVENLNSARTRRPRRPNRRRQTLGLPSAQPSADSITSTSEQLDADWHLPPYSAP